MFKHLPLKSTYKRNLISLITGTSLAQAIPIGISPILTRIYTPDDFGLAALYLSCVSVLAIIATGRYELAITLPASDKEAANVVSFTIKLCAVISLLLYLPIVLFGDQIAHLLGNASIRPWLHLLPVSVSVSCFYQILRYWRNRLAQYKAMSADCVQQSVLSSAFNLSLGSSHLPGAIILGPAVGQTISTALIGRKVWNQDHNLFQATTIDSESAMASRYSQLPTFVAPAQLVGMVGTQMPTFILSNLFSLNLLGSFSLAYKIINLPSALIANAIGDVYRQQAAIAYNERGEFRYIFLKTLQQTVLLSFFPFFIIYIVSPQLFTFVFGPDWRIAGEFARILTVAAFFQFISTPLDKGALIVGANRYIFYWHMIRFLSFVSLVPLVRYYDLSVNSFLLILVLTNTILYTVDVMVEYKLSGGKLMN